MSDVVGLERDVIVGLMKGFEARDIMPRFTAEYFSAMELRQLFGITKAYYEHYNELPDIEVVKNELTKSEKMSPEAVTKLKMFVSKAEESNLVETKFRYAILEVEKSFATRRLKENMKNAVGMLDKGLPFEAQEYLFNGLINLASFGREVTVVDFADTVGQRAKDLINRKENPELIKQYCIATGISGVDNELDGGLRKGELGLWLAPPEGGKSVSLQNIAMNSALNGYRTALFTIEMTPMQTASRLDSVLTGIRYKSFRRATIEDAEFEYWIETVKKLPSNRLKIIGVPEGCSCRLIEAELKRLGVLFRPDLIVVDYAGIMSPNDGRYNNSMDWKYVGEIVKNLKGLALKLNVPVWSACQLLVGAKEKDNLSFSDIGLARQQISAHADICIGLVRTSQMIEMDTARLQFVKAREGVMRRFIDVTTDFDKIRLSTADVGTKTAEPEQAEEVAPAFVPPPDQQEWDE